MRDTGVAMDDNQLLLRVPWEIKPGEELVIGEARIRREEDGDVEACDAYGCATARVNPTRKVLAAPIPGIYRLLTATPYLYVEFEKRIHVEPGSTYWTLAPYDIEVYVGHLSLVRLSPVKVKFTLIGDVVDGTLARYYKSVAMFSRDDLPDPVGTAIVAFHVKGENVLLPGIGFNAGISKFFVDSNGMVYYPLLNLESSGIVTTIKNTLKPPLPGLREVVEVSERKIGGFMSIFQQAAPFIMRVEMVRRVLTTQ